MINALRCERVTFPCAADEGTQRMPQLTISSPQQVRHAVSSTLRTASFENAPTLAALLSFLVEEEIAGRGTALNAHAIATAALGLPETFDPAIDPTVRVQVGRLRRVLDRAWVKGCETTIRITVPSGSYRPVFLTTSSPSLSDD